MAAWFLIPGHLLTPLDPFESNCSPHYHWNNCLLSRWGLFPCYCLFSAPPLLNLSPTSAGPEQPNCWSLCPFMSFSRWGSLCHFWPVLNSLSPPGFSSLRHGPPCFLLYHFRFHLDLGQSLDNTLEAPTCSHCFSYVNFSSAFWDKKWCYYFAGGKLKCWEFMFLTWKFQGITLSLSLISTCLLVSSLWVSYLLVILTQNQTHIPVSPIFARPLCSPDLIDCIEFQSSLSASFFVTLRVSPATSQLSSSVHFILKYLLFLLNSPLPSKRNVLLNLLYLSYWSITAASF